MRILFSLLTLGVIVAFLLGARRFFVTEAAAPVELEPLTPALWVESEPVAVDELADFLGVHVYSLRVRVDDPLDCTRVHLREWRRDGEEWRSTGVISGEAWDCASEGIERVVQIFFDERSSPPRVRKRVEGLTMTVEWPDAWREGRWQFPAGPSGWVVDGRRILAFEIRDDLNVLRDSLDCLERFLEVAIDSRPR